MNRSARVLPNNFFILVGALLIATNAAVAFDVIGIRQILVAVSFFVLPGLLVLYILNVVKTGFVKRAVLSVALSISVLIFAGLSINLLLPRFGVARPLSTMPLLLSFDVLLLLLLGVVYARHRGAPGRDLSQINLTWGDFFNPPVLAACIFPFLAIGSVAFMNVYGSNALIFALILSILVYVCLVVRFSDRVPKATYPSAVVLIAISLLVMIPFRSNMMIGGDGATEYSAFIATAANMYWNPESSLYISACLGGALLDTICHSLFNTSVEWTFKLVTPLVFSLAYLCSYELFKRQLGERLAFLCSIFFVFQALFVPASTGNIRVMFGLLFVILAISVLFDDTLRRGQRDVLFLVFLFSLVVTYYSYAYMFFIFLLLSWVIAKLLRLKTSSSVSGGITITAILLMGVAIFLWYGQITYQAGNYADLVNFFIGFAKSASSSANLGARDQFTQQAFGVGIASPADNVNRVLYYLPLGLMTVGAISLLKKRDSARFDLPMIVSCLLFWAVAIVNPYVSRSALGLDRVYFFTLIVMTPLLVIGTAAIANVFTRSARRVTSSFSRTTLSHTPSSATSSMQNNNSMTRSRFISLVLLVIIASQLAINTGLTYQAFGSNRMAFINSAGPQFDAWSIYPQEVTAGTWIVAKGPNYKIYSDVYSPARLAVATAIAANRSIGTSFFKALYLYNDTSVLTRPDHFYVYLRYQNVMDSTVSVGLIRKTDESTMPLSNFAHALSSRSKIYDSGGAQVLFK